MRTTIIFMAALCLLTGCRKSLEDRCEQEAREFTEKKCPTQIGKNMIIDSLTFDRTTHTLHYYYTVQNSIDDDIPMELLFRGKAQFLVLRDEAKTDSARVREVLDGIETERFEQWRDSLSFLTDKSNIEEVNKRLEKERIRAQARTNNDDGRTLLLQSVKNSTNLKLYKDKGYNFAYTYCSEKDPKKVYFDVTFTENDYN